MQHRACTMEFSVDRDRWHERHAWMSLSSSCTARLRESASTIAPDPDSSARMRMAEKFSGRSSSNRARLTSSPYGKTCTDRLQRKSIAPSA